MNEIVLSAKTGSASALSQLLVMSDRYVRSVVTRYLGTRYQSQVDVDDVTQDCLISIARDVASSSAQDWDSYKGWLATVARNTTYKAITKIKAARRGADKQESAPEGFVAAGCEATPDKTLADRETIDAIYAEADSIGGNTSQAIRMVAAGYTSREISEALGITDMAVAGLLKRLRRKVASMAV
jgi:RNA polymerase sigma factor (sigma-70 family)